MIESRTESKIGKIVGRTRVLPLALGTVLFTKAYLYGVDKSFPDLVPPFDMNEHAAHLTPGLALGYASRIVAENVGVRRERSLAFSIGAAGLAGSLFETGFFDGVYRNTTHSVADAVWTTTAGLVGALCVRHNHHTE